MLKTFAAFVTEHLASCFSKKQKARKQVRAKEVKAWDVHGSITPVVRRVERSALSRGVRQASILTYRPEQLHCSGSSGARAFPVSQWRNADD